MLPKSVIGRLGAVLIVLALFGFAFVLLGPSSRQVVPRLPNPNGYDELLKATGLIAASPIDFRNLQLEELRELVRQNRQALAAARVGLAMDCGVAIPSSNAQVLDHIKSFVGLMNLALALAAEGRLAELEGRPDSATESYLAVIELGHDCSHGGPIIDKLVGVAIEAIGLEPLRMLSPRLDVEQCRKLIVVLETLEAQREPFDEVFRNERAYVKHTVRLHERLGGLVAFRAIQRTNASAQQKLQQWELQARTTLVDLAVRAYELEKGQRPTNWAALVPGYLKAIPLDPITGTNLVYQF